MTALDSDGYNTLLRWILGAGVIYCCVAALGGALLSGADALRRRGKRRAAVALLDFVLAARFPLPRQNRRGLELLAGAWRLEAGEPERALRTLARLDAQPLAPVHRAECERYKAECYLALGQRDAAARARENADASLARAPQNWVSLKAEAQLLKSQGRIAEAYAAYERLLPLIPDALPGERDVALAYLATESVICGEGMATLDWATRLLSTTTNPDFAATGYKMAAVGASGRGDYELAERYCREGLRYLRERRMRGKEAELNGQYASLVARRPAPEEAMRMFDSIIAEHPANAMITWSHKGELLYALGDFRGGIAAFESGMACVRPPLTSATRRMLATKKLGVARGFAMLGDAAEARRLLEEAAADHVDGKMALWRRAMLVYCAAIAGESPQAVRELTDTLYADMQGFLNDKGVCLTCLSNAARSARVIQDWAACEGYTQRMLTLPLAPAERALPWFLLGECYRGYGNEKTAGEWYRQAAAVHPALYYSRLAAEALADGARTAVPARVE